MKIKIKRLALFTHIVVNCLDSMHLFTYLCIVADDPTSRHIIDAAVVSFWRQRLNGQRVNQILRLPANSVFRSCHVHCPAPFQATATMLLPGEVTATAWLLAAYTCDVVYARQCSYPVSALSGVHLPGKSTVGRR